MITTKELLDKVAKHKKYMEKQVERMGYMNNKAPNTEFEHYLLAYTNALDHLNSLFDD